MTREGGPALRHGEALLPLFCPHTMESVPATVPSVPASAGDSELLGPLSVLYAALIAKLLEVTVPIPGEGPQLWQAGGLVLSGAGSLADGAREKRSVSGLGQAGPAELFKGTSGRVSEKVSSLVRFLLSIYGVVGTVLLAGM